jgi:Transposase, Mutator family
LFGDKRPCGTNDVLIAVVNDLKDYPEAITAVFPETVVRTCIVHLIRYSLPLASCKEHKPITAALKPVYRAEHAEAAQRAGGVWPRRMGPRVPGHRPELAPEPGGGAHESYRWRKVCGLPDGSKVRLNGDRVT